MDPGILRGMTLARQLWQAYEPYHAIVYWAPEARSATDALGCSGYWMGYFGMRAAPLGHVVRDLRVRAAREEDRFSVDVELRARWPDGVDRA